MLLCFRYALMQWTDEMLLAVTCTSHDILQCRGEGWRHCSKIFIERSQGLAYQAGAEVWRGYEVKAGGWLLLKEGQYLWIKFLSENCSFLRQLHYVFMSQRPRAAEHKMYLSVLMRISYQNSWYVDSLDALIYQADMRVLLHNTQPISHLHSITMNPGFHIKVHLILLCYSATVDQLHHQMQYLLSVAINFSLSHFVVVLNCLSAHQSTSQPSQVSPAWQKSRIACRWFPIWTPHPSGALLSVQSYRFTRSQSPQHLFESKKITVADWTLAKLQSKARDLLASLSHVILDFLTLPAALRRVACDQQAALQRC